MNHQHNANAIFTPLNRLPLELQKPRLRHEVLQQIHSDPQTSLAFQQLEPEAQEALIQFCIGNRGLKITYDPFFHRIFDPERYPERLNQLLSSILKQSVKVIKILPREGIRLTENASLVIMDILVETSDGSLINVEIQKSGYLFPVQRSFCYGADMLARQYATLRATKKESFSYKDMRPVYVIVFMENSPSIFSKYPDTFIHRSVFTFDTGIHLENLLNFIYIPLDIFRNMPHNNIEELEAWLYFLSSDEPRHIQQIAEKYPFFQELYQEIINFRYEPKELINMYSEALAIMDRNTINLMIDEMKEEMEQLNVVKTQLTNKNAQLSDENAQLSDENAQLKALLAKHNIQY